VDKDFEFTENMHTIKLKHLLLLSEALKSGKIFEENADWIVHKGARAVKDAHMSVYFMEDIYF
jgi:hypothetical protein